ncbi:RNA polymerase sigma factor [Acidobacteria bacterium AH-259-G07]|nr:RNA polymerase sigma factor [Acidobacteria bacterium AH-259-L09]MDA2927838.1 RNA polymerase sigma factor [Acidobacteria bacterium AH-259-G07]
MLERIWRKNQAILRSIVHNILIDPSGVEDVLQEAFAKLLRSNTGLYTEQEAYNYIRRVVLNTTIDHYRFSKRRNTRFTNSVEANSCHLSQNQANPLTLLIEKENEKLQNSILEEVRKTLEELPSEQKEAIDITFNRNHARIKDICKERGIPYSTLRSRVTAGIDRIRNRLKAKGFYRTFEEVR